jgi:hypothetical protein
MLQTSGLQTGALVTALQPSNHGGCSYTYAVGKRNFSGSQQACPGGALVGSRVEVTYVSSDPSVSVIGSPSGLLASHLFISLLVPTVVAAGVGLTGQRRRGSTSRTAPYSGEPIP